MELLKFCFICADAALMPELWDSLKRFESWPQLDAAQSAPIYLEVMKRGVTKAHGIQKAVEIAGMQNRKLVCLGDYQNDYEMLKLADIAACPENAVEEILEIADIVTCSNNEGAFADLLTKLP